MKLLVVDDDESFGRLMGRTVRRLGHKPVVALHAQDALAALREQEIDAVITDIDMPEMDGVELARAIRVEFPELPIAFCTGSSGGPRLAEAQQLGRVLPKVWTVADVKDVLAELARGCPRIAVGSRTGLPPMNDRVAGALVAHRPPAPARKIRVTCRTWAQVSRLCDQHGVGKKALTLRGNHRLQAGEALLIALSLPDELVLSLSAEVAGVRRDSRGTPVFHILVTGLDDAMRARLRAMVAAAGVPAEVPVEDAMREATPTRRSALRIPSASLGSPARGDVVRNDRLREQIESLPEKMRPPTLADHGADEHDGN